MTQVDEGCEAASAAPSVLRPKPGFVALDRDGTIISYVPYLTRESEMKLIPGVADGIRLLNEHNIPVYIVTNQSVVGRGMLSLEGLNQLHATLTDLLAEQGARINAVFTCTHVPEDGCQCRKPAPGLLERAALRAGMPIGSGVVIGDSEGDIRMALSRGAYALHVQTGVQYELPRDLGVLSVPDLAAAIDMILSAR